MPFLSRELAMQSAPHPPLLAAMPQPVGTRAKQHWRSIEDVLTPANVRAVHRSWTKHLQTLSQKHIETRFVRVSSPVAGILHA